MKITYKELSEDLDAVIEARKKDPLEKYELEIQGEMKNPPAMKVLEMMDGARDFETRAQFVKDVLVGCKVIIYRDGKKTVELGVTPGVQWWAVNEFNDDPMALRYLVTCVYTKYLKKYVA